MKTFGLVGYPLGHSFSKGYFTKKFNENLLYDCKYENFEIASINQLPEVINNTGSLIGLNVTIPFKEAVIPYLDELSDAAKCIMAVNTIKITRVDGIITLKGYNTDVIGFEKSLIYYGIKVPEKVLILGTGGASKAVKWVIDKSNAKTFFGALDPSGENHLAYDQIMETGLKDYKLIINTTPLGMYPEINTKPILPYDTLTTDHVLYDLVYNPTETLFMKEGIKRNCMTINGLYMLRQQAEESWQIWNNP